MVSRGWWEDNTIDSPTVSGRRFLRFFGPHILHFPFASTARHHALIYSREKKTIVVSRGCEPNAYSAGGCLNLLLVSYTWVLRTFPHGDLSRPIRQSENTLLAQGMIEFE